MPIFIWLSLVSFVVPLFLFPLFFGELMLGGLGKLHVSPKVAVALVLSIIVGGFINIPVKRLVREQDLIVHPFAVFGFSDLWSKLRYARRETIIAVNVGGCLIPSGLAIYEFFYLAAAGWKVVGSAGVACVLNSIVCYIVARPVPGTGIVMPGFLSAAVAAGLALLITPDQTGPVAFIAGVIGPLVGADLLYLKDITKSAIGVASIGGAGTFDGIVLSGIVAAYLA